MHVPPPTAVVFAMLAVSSLAIRPALAVSFTGLGYLPGVPPGAPGPFSTAVGISADGAVVVGTSSSAAGLEAFRWTSSEGMVGLGALPGGVRVSAITYGVSADGAVVVGRSDPLGAEAFRWTAEGGMVGIGDLPGGASGSAATGASADGSVVVGWGYSPSGTPNISNQEAFRWTSAGMVGLGDLTGGPFASSATGVSAEGSVVVGRGLSASGDEAFRWTSTGGMVGLGDLPGGVIFSVASGVSADGTVVVGNTSSASGGEAFRWTAGGGMVGLGDLPGGNFSSQAVGVSPDGSLVVGTSSTEIFTSPAGIATAFLWDPVFGMRDIRSVLTAKGIDMTGWRLTTAAAVIDDGLGTSRSIKIVGTGVRTPGNRFEAWLAEIPEPSTLGMLGVGLAGVALLRRRQAPL